MSGAANLVNVEGATKGYGTRVLLDAVSLGVAVGDRVGVVGRNGGGKTTLVSILAGAVAPDAGRVTHTGSLTVGLLGQTDELGSGTVRDAVLGDRPDHAWAGEARAREVVEALLGGIPLQASLGPLSGGERRRVSLAALLVDDPDLLVLDEPTNHLDVEGVAWLADHLAARRGAVVVVTHDRWFLDAVCTTTWEVADAQVRAYDGGYAAYVLARAERARQAEATEQRRQNVLRKELAWLRRGPPARTTKPRFRIEAANALIADEPAPRDDVELVRFASARLGRQVYDVEDVDIRLGDRELFSRLTWRLGPGERLGVVGVNGAGKSTLLRLLAGEVKPVAGRVVVGRTVRSAYLSQEVVELDPTQRVLESVEEVASAVDLGKGRTLTAAQLVERLGFTRDRAWTPVGDLSGGERRRLQLVRLLMAEPNVLLLDEPTNDLDTDTLASLEDLLDGFAGTLVVVSHDRYLLERVCSRVVGVLGDGTLRDLPGGVDEYLELRARAHRDRGPAAPTAPASVASPAPAPGRSAAAERGVRKELARLERQLERLSADETRLHEELATAATDPQRLLALDAQLRDLVARRATLEDRWLEVSHDG